MPNIGAMVPGGLVIVLFASNGAMIRSRDSRVILIARHDSRQAHGEDVSRDQKHENRMKLFHRQAILYNNKSVSPPYSELIRTLVTDCQTHGNTAARLPH